MKLRDMYNFTIAEAIAYNWLGQECPRLQGALRAVDAEASPIDWCGHASVVWRDIGNLEGQEPWR